MPQALWVANALAYVCTHSASDTSLAWCQANAITTYTDSTGAVTCPSSTPLVQLPGSTCTSSTGTAANIGFWYSGGTVDYWIVSAYGTYGPYTPPTSFPQPSQANLGILGNTFNVMNTIYAGGAIDQNNTDSGTINSGSTTLTLAGDCGVCIWPVGTYVGVSQGSNYSGARFLAKIISVDSVGGVATALHLDSAPAFSVSGPSGKYNVWEDDTAAIQAASDACHNAGIWPLGGVVQLPGGVGSYIISSTIYMHQGCQFEGIIGNYGNSPSSIFPNFPAAGVTATITAFTVATNCTTGGCGTASKNYPFINGNVGNQPELASSVVTFTATNSYKANDWIDVLGCTTANGLYLNHLVFQVSSATSNSFVAVTNGLTLSAGSYTESCTATSRNILFATTTNARYEQRIQNLSISNPLTPFDIGFFFGGRIDSGTYIDNDWVSQANEYDFYFSNGGINVFFDHGWRGDHAKQGAIYWRLIGSDNLALNNGEVDNRVVPLDSTTPMGPMIVIDGQTDCLYGRMILSINNVKVEVNSTIQPGEGVVTIFDCPLATNPPVYMISTNALWNAPGQYGSNAGYNDATFAMLPANDEQITLNIVNSVMPTGNGSSTSKPFIGITGAQNSWATGVMGVIPYFYYATAFNSSGIQGSTAPMQDSGDLNIQQLLQYGVQASTMLYTDTALSNLQAGTTVYAGQIVGPPAYWKGANGKRYAQSVVYTGGTTGTLNGGSTTCQTPVFNVAIVSVASNIATVTGTMTISSIVYAGNYSFAGTGEAWLNGNSYNITPVSGSNTSFTFALTGHNGYSNSSDTGTATSNYNLICNSATGLGTGEFLSIGSNVGMTLANFDATNTAAVALFMRNVVTAVGSPSALSFTAPVLGLEMQLATKTTGSPSTLAWSQGDWEQNAAATANGIAGYVNVSAGTPGTWAGIPLGDVNGKLAFSSQITGVATGTVTSASGTTTTAHTFSVSFTGTPNCVGSPLSNSGAWYFSTVPTSSSTGVITYATSGAQTFNLHCVGVGGAW
jgi:hypothetical protein